MSYSSTLGETTTRVVEMEESYELVQGFTYSGTMPVANQMVKLVNDGTVTGVSAATDRVLGRVISSYQGTDTGRVRVYIPCEAMVHAKASGTIDEGNELACVGFDTTTSRPIYGAAVATNCVSAIAFSAGLINEDVVVGILRQPYIKA